jgi:hypothetical protein
MPASRQVVREGGMVVAVQGHRAAAGVHPG